VVGDADTDVDEDLAVVSARRFLATVLVGTGGDNAEIAVLGVEIASVIDVDKGAMESGTKFSAIVFKVNVENEFFDNKTHKKRLFSFKYSIHHSSFTSFIHSRSNNGLQH
jgi:hypothetical protein